MFPSIAEPFCFFPLLQEAPADQAEEVAVDEPAAEDETSNDQDVTEVSSIKSIMQSLVCLNFSTHDAY